MTETLTIDRISATAPDDAHGLASRVERIIRRVADDRLDRVLGSYLLAPAGVWCVSRVQLIARLDFERPDSSLEEVVARAVLDAITAAVQGPAATHYRNPVEALAGLLAAASTRRFDTAWVWLRLGLIGDVDQLERQPASCVLDALARHPEHAVGAIVHAVHAVGLPRLHHLLGESGWVRLAGSVLEACVGVATWALFAALVRDGQACLRTGVGATWADVGASSPSGGATSDDTASTSRGGAADDIALVSRIITASPLAAAARASRLRFEGPVALAFGVLVVAESEPAMLHRGAAMSLCLGVARVLSGITPIVGETHAATTESRPRAHHRETSALPGLTERDVREGSVTASDNHGDSDSDNDEPTGDRTEHAGLLFLLNAAADAEMPDALLDDPSFVAVAPSELLARTAMALAPIEPDDPVVLAFGGIDPRRAHHHWARPLSEPLMERIGMHASTWAAAAAGRLGRQDEDPLSVMTEIAGRRGRIEREQGWLEVHLSLDAVDVDVRRAGLDIDPGWVPWLGTVVRFRYA